MDPRMRIGVLVGVLVLVAALVLASPATTPDRGETSTSTRTEATVKYVRPSGNSTVELWPFTSRAPSFDRATLPINLVLREDPDTVRRLLTNEGGHPRATGADEWNETVPARAHEPPAGIEWGRGHGANRYTFVRTADGGHWQAQGDQLRDGSYFGTQYHLRVYGVDSGSTAWTAIQAHHEHWDWFRLRHTVDSVSGAQHHVERDLADRRVIRDISRQRFGNGGAIDADGWATVVDLEPSAALDTTTEVDNPARSGPGPGGAAIVLPVLGLVLAARTRLDPEDAGILARLDRDHVTLVGSTVALLPLVRAGGILLDRTFPGTPPWVLGAPLFLGLVVGYPAMAHTFGRDLPAEEAFAAAVLGMGAGILIDYSYTGVTALPYDAVVQRVVLLCGLGLIAAGGTRWAERPLARHRYRLVGLAIWVWAIAKPILGL